MPRQGPSVILKTTQGSTSSPIPPVDIILPPHFSGFFVSHHESSTCSLLRMWEKQRCENDVFFFFKSTTFSGFFKTAIGSGPKSCFTSSRQKGKSTGLGVKGLDFCSASAMTSFCCFFNICRVPSVCAGVFSPHGPPVSLTPRTLEWSEYKGHFRV